VLSFRATETILTGIRTKDRLLGVLASVSALSETTLFWAPFCNWFNLRATEIALTGTRTQGQFFGVLTVTKSLPDVKE
jgi:uncharacterized membrane protein